MKNKFRVVIIISSNMQRVEEIAITGTAGYLGIETGMKISDMLGLFPEDTENDPYLNAAIAYLIPVVQMYTDSYYLPIIQQFMIALGVVSRQQQKQNGGRLSDWIFYYANMAGLPEEQKARRKAFYAKNTRRRTARRRHR
jgi:hypothetical protein